MAITTPYSRVPGYPQEHISREGMYVTDKIRCDWVDRVYLAKELAGFVVGGTIQPPFEYDAGDEPLNFLYVTDVDIEPIIGLDAATGDYKKALLTVTYRSLDYDIDGTTYVSESLEPSMDYITLTKEKSFWADGTEASDHESPQFLVQILDWVYTLHHVTTLTTSMFSLQGYINNAPVFSKSLNVWWPTGTLLALSPSMSREITSLGTTAWQVNFRFSYKNYGTYDVPLGWNYFLKSSAAADISFELLYRETPAVNVKYVYQSADFSGVII